ncbi:MAG: hypothetical protein LKI04_22465 [Paenibacillus lautus]|uniref:hypothetical protein n=1 Tax=Paenibacillus lautus TaxID=1401 RepID=UPI0026F23CB4|nr:hypothetical protein [Paenibacillus lautus]MCI1776778.1 hypothetical protein [Paenibacillus lautus]
MEIYELGRVIYFDKSSGVVLYETGEIRSSDPNYFVNVDHYTSIKALADRVRDTIGEIHLGPRKYEQDFNVGVLERIDPETKQLYFYCPIDPDDLEEPPVSIPPLTEQVKALEAKNAELENLVAERLREQKCII